jgi:NADH dehydrogenase/NADH:ubiquinone oxidoreductase subunit G
MCLRCVTACQEIKGIGAISVKGDGYGAQVVTVDADKCQSCGENAGKLLKKPVVKSY